MVVAVQALQRERKVILVPHQSFEPRAGIGDHDCPLRATIRIVGRILYSHANLVDRPAGSIAGKIGTNKSSLTLHHVTFRTSCLAAEQCLPTYRVAEQLGDAAFPLQKAKVCHNLLDKYRAQRCERWHPSSRNSVLKNS